MGHFGKAPIVIRMPEDQISLNANFPQLFDSHFQVTEKYWVETCEIESVLLIAGESVIERFIVIEGIVFGEHAHSEFIKGRVPQSFKRLFLQFQSLAGPGVAGRAYRLVIRPVRIGKAGIGSCLVFFAERAV